MVSDDDRNGSGASTAWPAMPIRDWSDTRDTFHLYLQVIGKIRIACDPPTNHWWNSTMYLTSRGLTTSLMPHPSGPAFQIDLDHEIASGIVPVIAVSDLDHDVVTVSAVNEAFAGEPVR